MTQAKQKTFELFQRYKKFTFKHPTDYYALYDEWIRTLNPIELNMELRYTESNWRRVAISKLAAYYKREHNEDWII